MEITARKKDRNEDTQQVHNVIVAMYEMYPWVSLHRRVRRSVELLLVHVNKGRLFPWMTVDVAKFRDNIPNLRVGRGKRKRDSQEMEDSNLDSTEYALSRDEIVTRFYFAGAYFWSQMLRDPKVDRRVEQLPTEWARLLQLAFPLCKKLWHCVDITFLPIYRTSEGGSVSGSGSATQSARRARKFAQPMLLSNKNPLDCANLLSLLLCTGVWLLQCSLHGEGWHLLPPCVAKEIQLSPNFGVDSNSNSNSDSNSSPTTSHGGFQRGSHKKLSNLLETYCAYYWKVPEQQRLPWFLPHTESLLLTLLIDGCSRLPLEAEDAFDLDSSTDPSPDQDSDLTEADSLVFEWKQERAPSKIYLFTTQQQFQRIVKKHNLTVTTACVPKTKSQATSTQITSPHWGPSHGNVFQAVCNHMSLFRWPKRTRVH